MRAGYKWALFYTTIAIIMLVAGFITQITSYLYGAIILAVVSFYWMFREQIKTRVKRK